MMSSNSYALSSSVNVANFVSVRPCLNLKGDDDFKMWEEQMMCLLESQDVAGLVNGEVEPLIKEASELHYKEWRRRDRLVKGWILGSIGKDTLDAVWGEPTARAVWLELHRIFESKLSQEDCYDHNQSELRQEDCYDHNQSELRQGDSFDNHHHDDEYDQRNDADYSRYSAVYKAAQVGDWDAAKNFFHGNIDELSTTIITRDSETALHVAVLAGGTVNSFVRRLVEATSRGALALKDSVGRTALHKAAVVGNTEAAAALVRKNPDLLHILSDMCRLPVLEAAINCKKETLEYLISEHEAEAEAAHSSPSLFQDQLGIQLLNEIIGSQFVDIALHLVRKYPNLTLLTSRDGRSALPTVIAATYTLFRSTDTFTSWQNFIYHSIPSNRSTFEALAFDIESLSGKNCFTSFRIISRERQKLEDVIWNVIDNLVPGIKELRDKKARHEQALQLAEFLCNQIVSELAEREALEIFKISIMEAANYGVSEIAEMIIDKKPSIIYHGHPRTGMNLFMLAATYRYDNVFNLIYNMSDRKYMLFDYTDDDNNNLLHICGKLAPPHRLNLVAGAALQMQREIQWFKEMEKFVNPSRRAWLNNDWKTPQMVFTEEHEALRREGELWMKETSNACTIAATLIATVMFAAAFTVPGGLETTTGVPLFAGQTAFNIFVVSDTISLFTSVASLLAFLSIVTSRYAEDDFLYLTKRLSVGMLTLFVSITFMLVAFSATLYLVPYANANITWFAIVLGAAACLPATSLVLVQFPLLVDVVYSTYGPGIFGKRSNRMLY